jgi:hypothetical protein
VIFFRYFVVTCLADLKPLLVNGKLKLAPCIITVAFTSIRFKDSIQNFEMCSTSGTKCHLTSLSQWDAEAMAEIAHSTEAKKLLSWLHLLRNGLRICITAELLQKFLKSSGIYPKTLKKCQVFEL